MKFIMNAATDTLPHNVNLARWRGKSVTDKCRLCNERQSLLHVLNNCSIALHLRRYNHRHDRALEVIAELMKSYLPDSFQCTVDLQGSVYNFPHNIIPTNLRPDIVIWSEKKKEIHLIELTIAFETGFKEAQQRKSTKYADLITDASGAGYKASVVTLQVGSRGVLDGSGFVELRTHLAEISKSKWKNFQLKLIKVVMEESFKIWCMRNTSS